MDVDVDMDIDSEMAISLNWGGSPLKRGLGLL